MNTRWKRAYAEALAVCRHSVAVMETLELRHPLWEAPFYLIRDRVDAELTLETGETVTFTACPFRMSLPEAGENGVQELQLAIDDVDRAVSDALELLADSTEPVQLFFRPYLSTDTTAPQMDPPLRLFLTDARSNAVEVTGRATFADVLNRRFPSQVYSRRRFPALQ